MKWDNESTIQDKMFKLMEKVRKNKIYVIVTIAVLALALILFIPKKKDIHIELVGADVVNLYVGDTYEELGFNAYDKDKKSYNDKVVVDSNLNTNFPGTYEITYSINNKEVTRTVIVVEKPKKYYEIIFEEVNDDKTIYLKINSEFKDPGYKIFNNDGMDVTENVEVKVSGEVDTSKAGNYILLYEFKGPNDEEISAKRDVIVIDNKLNLSLDKTTPTNLEVTIKVEAIDDYIDYILLPNGEKTDKKEYSYLVQENGTYKFVLYNKKGFNVEKSIEVKTIDKEKPTGTCSSIIKNGKTTVKIDADDNIGISKYIVNGNNYTSKEIILTSEVKVINASIYDTAGNETKITCNSVKRNMTVTKKDNTNNYTNKDVVVDVEVEYDDFSYLKLPNGAVTNSSTYSYAITQNGTHTFTAYDTKGGQIQKSITVNNIDKTLPSGNCYIKKNNTGTYIEINASDNIGIKNYIYNNKTYTTNIIDLTSIPSTATISIYDKANNKRDINCINLAKPTINSITNKGVIVSIKATKSGSDIAGYYFSYTNQRPKKGTGGYLPTSNANIDVVRLPGTTYVWVEDKNGNISDVKTITLTNDVLFLFDSKQTILSGTHLSTYLSNKGWSIDELNKLIARSVRAAGIYTKESAATAAVSLVTVLGQKYNIKIPYWWGGKSWILGAESGWGRSNPLQANGTTYKYYGLDCTGFTTWAYVNAGYQVAKNTYPYYLGMSRLNVTKENGEVGDFLSSSGHIKIIIGKTDQGFLTAEAKGNAHGTLISLHPYNYGGGYWIIEGESFMELYSKIDVNNYPSGF